MRKNIIINLLLAYIILLTACGRSTSPLVNLESENSLIMADVPSSDNVTGFVMDKSGKMWIATSFGLNLYDGYRFLQFYHDDENNASIPDSQINCIFCDKQGNIWIGTERGLAQYIGYNRFKSYNQENDYSVLQIVETSDERLLIQTKSNIYELKSDKLVETLTVNSEMYTIKTDNKGGFWLLTPQRCTYFNKNYQQEKVIENTTYANMVYAAKRKNQLWVSQSRKITCIDMDTQNILYEGKENIHILPDLIFPTEAGAFLKSSRHGIFFFDLKNKVLEKNTNLGFLTLEQTKLISSMYKDDNDNLWIGFNNGGFQFLNETNHQIKAINRDTLFTCTAGQYIVSLASHDKMLWGGTNTNLFCYNNNTNHFYSINQENIFTDSPYFRQTLHKIIPTNECIWILTNVRILTANYQKEKLNVERSINLKPLLGDCVVEDKACYITADSKYLFAVKKDGAVDSIPVNHPSYNRKCRLLNMENGKLLLAMQGLEFMLFDTKTKQFFPLSINKPSYSANVQLTSLLKDSKGEIWLGSNGHGLLHLNLNKKEIEKIPFLPAMQVMSLLADQNGTIWMGTRKGIMSFSPSSKLSYLYNVNTKASKPYRVFNQGAICMMDSNRIILGAVNGCIAIPPLMERKKVDPHLEIRNICTRINGNLHSAVDENNNDNYVFAYNENDLEINFGGVNFGNIPLFRYEYMLEGFEHEWIPAGTNHNVFYSSLPAGDYRFKVRVMQSYGSSIIDEKSISIKILKAPWLTTPALILYVVICIALIVYINHLYLRIRSNHMALQLANADKEREQRTNQMNMSFFANISHEFRNPLTMIVGPVIALYNDKTLPIHVHRKLAVVKQSINSMLKLIDQMLDFNQLENDVLRLKVAQFDIVREINAWADIFAETTQEHHINLERKGLESPYYTFLDHDKLDKILSNLFTNALKHTPEDGIIRISFSIMTEQEAITHYSCPPNGGKDFLCIDIFNDGKHIPEDKLDDVFKRYYQVKELNENHQHGWGTGIGLYYVKRLVQLHRGDIKVDNIPSGGVSFSFVIPSGEEAYANDEHIKEEDIMKFTNPASVPETKISSEEQWMNDENKLAQKPKILIIDDDTQLNRYLRSIFCEDYQVISKYSAESALNDMEKIAPDIILSDVIMGEISGYDFCRTMKEDRTYSHIPIILITAKSDMNEQIEGLETGAIGYVTKPFNPDYLKALVRSQLTNCEHLRKLLNENIQIPTTENGLSEQDKIFMNELYQLMEKHLEDLDLNLSTICEALHISRSKFNYKIKGLTGDTPNNFFKTYKLNRAAKLLKEGKNNVSEVAMLTGFGTVSYFSVCFKKHFGVSPSEYQ